MVPYLMALTARVSQGLAELDEQRRQRHVQFLRAAQLTDGGFPGREGCSDLYYTGFALRSLAVLGELDANVARAAASYLQQHLTGQRSIIDFFSLIYGAAVLESAAAVDVFADQSPLWRQEVVRALEMLRRDDGGYAKGAEGAASSTYHTFLVLLCYELINHSLTDPERVVDFLMSQRSDDGGFREIRVQKRGATNPTAAAVASLKILRAMEDSVQEEVVEFLVEMQNEEGGLRANTRIPIADLLSTFTGYLTLLDLGAADQIDSVAAVRYANSLEMSNGGYRGAAWDEGVDVEYTFYGLGCAALLGVS